jgi:hypothetical protein
MKSANNIFSTAHGEPVIAPQPGHRHGLQLPRRQPSAQAAALTAAHTWLLPWHKLSSSTISTGAVA